MNRKALKAGAAGIAKNTFGRKAGAHESDYRKTLKSIQDKEMEEERRQLDLATTQSTVMQANAATFKDDPKLAAHQGKKFSDLAIDLTKARIIFSNGRVDAFADNSIQLASYYGLPKGTRAAFRAIGDASPVYPWSCVDR